MGGGVRARARARVLARARVGLRAWPGARVRGRVALLAFGALLGLNHVPFLYTARDQVCCGIRDALLLSVRLRLVCKGTVHIILEVERVPASAR